MASSFSTLSPSFASPHTLLFNRITDKTPTAAKSPSSVKYLQVQNLTTDCPLPTAPNSSHTVSGLPLHPPVNATTITMSEVTEITTVPQFHTTISSLSPTALVCISFHTPWAAPCTQMSLILRTLASSYPPQQPPIVSFLSLDAEQLPDVSESYEVTAVPFLVLQRDGKVLENVGGSDAGKVREAVERWAGKGGNTSKVLPPALDAKRRNEEQTNGTGSREATKDLSGYTPSSNDPATAPEMSSTQGQKEELDKRISELVKAAPVMLFMKGTPSAPQCGFSRQLVGLLREQGVRYGFFNILADEEVRQGLKVYSEWPTFPQLYLKGELVGGLDIVSFSLLDDGGGSMK